METLLSTPGPQVPDPRSARLGDLVVAAFDEAARYCRSPRELSRVATQTVGRVLLRERTRTPAGWRRLLFRAAARPTSFLESPVAMVRRGALGGRASW